MTPEAFEAHGLSLPGAHGVVQWGGAHVLKLGPRIFALARAPGGAAAFSFKASPLSYALLIEQGLARPAPYLARAGWVQTETDALSEADFCAYLGQAHALVAARLTRAERRALGLSAGRSEGATKPSPIG